jgi:hypothetical protein
MVEEIRNEQASVFNMALAYLQRIDNILTLCQTSSITKEYNTWFFALYSLLKEISPKITPEERTAFTNRLDNLYPIVKEYNTALAKRSTPSQKAGTIFPQLSNIEMDMRIMMNKLNLLMPRASDPRFALTGR